MGNKFEWPLFQPRLDFYSENDTATFPMKCNCSNSSLSMLLEMLGCFVILKRLRFSWRFIHLLLATKWLDTFNIFVT